MKYRSLAAADDEDLLQSYALIGVAQDDALAANRLREFNQLFAQKQMIERELKLRNGDQRSKLMELYSHPNMQVRLNAAKATLAVRPEQARRQLELISVSGEFPQAGDAGMSLWNLDRGVFKPT